MRELHLPVPLQVQEAHPGLGHAAVQYVLVHALPIMLHAHGHARVDELGARLYGGQQALVELARHVHHVAKWGRSAGGKGSIQDSAISMV